MLWVLLGKEYLKVDLGYSSTNEQMLRIDLCVSVYKILNLMLIMSIVVVRDHAKINMITFTILVGNLQDWEDMYL